MDNDFKVEYDKEILRIGRLSAYLENDFEHLNQRKFLVEANLGTLSNYKALLESNNKILKEAHNGIVAKPPSEKSE